MEVEEGRDLRNPKQTLIPNQKPKEISAHLKCS